MSPQKKLSFLFIYLLIPLPIICLWIGGWYTFLPFLIFFTLVPLMDVFLKDTRNPTPIEEKQLLKDKFFKYILFAYVPVQFMLLGLGLRESVNPQLQWNEWFGFTIALGIITGGAGINIAHEMMHKNDPVQQFLSRILLVTVCYGHFFIEHVKGHHVRVGTPNDPATAYLGESIYHFLPRTLIGGFRSAFNLEKKRLERKGYNVRGIHNHFWWIIIAPICLAFACFIYGGFLGLAFFLLQSATAITVLEIVNYIEHYGLERKKLANGQYEKVAPRHSWNANHWFSNMILFHLQRHSDHHTYGARPYQILRHVDDGPQLPSGYLGMLPVSLVPPLWRFIMDKRVLAYREELRIREHKDFEQNDNMISSGT